MRTFDYTNMTCVLDADVVKMIVQIYEHKGRQDLFIDQKPEQVATLYKVAMVQSTEASNKIEGIRTSEGRMTELMRERTMPETRDEEEIAGYRDVLDLVHNSYAYMPISKNTILQLHKMLYKYTNVGIAGRWKTTDNVIEETDSEGNKHVRFVPSAAYEVDELIEHACVAYNAALDGGAETLTAIFAFVLDFLCIHPFADGNGRMSRLLTLLMLYRSGFVVGKYISIERNIERTKEAYYSTLKESSVGWHMAANELRSFVTYSLGVLLAAYVDFEERVIAVSSQGTTKREQVMRLFDRRLGKITKADIKKELPNVSEVLIEKTLKDMLDNGLIQKVGAGRSTGYVKE